MFVIIYLTGLFVVICYLTSLVILFHKIQHRASHDTMPDHFFLERCLFDKDEWQKIARYKPHPTVDRSYLTVHHYTLKNFTRSFSYFFNPWLNEVPVMRTKRGTEIGIFFFLHNFGASQRKHLNKIAKAIR